MPCGWPRRRFGARPAWVPHEETGAMGGQTYPRARNAFEGMLRAYAATTGRVMFVGGVRGVLPRGAPRAPGRPPAATAARVVPGRSRDRSVLAPRAAAPDASVRGARARRGARRGFRAALPWQPAPARPGGDRRSPARRAPRRAGARGRRRSSEWSTPRPARRWRRRPGPRPNSRGSGRCGGRDGGRARGGRWSGSGSGVQDLPFGTNSRSTLFRWEIRRNEKL